MKKNGGLIYLSCFDEKKSLISKTYISNIFPKESYIISACKEKFYTEEPCIIYRTCIIKEWQLYFYEYIKRLKNSGILYFNLTDLPLQYQCLDFEKEIFSVTIDEGIL